MNKKRRVNYTFKHLLMIVASILSVFPFLWMIISATNTSAQISMGKMTFGSNLPANIRNAFESADIGRAFFNSAYVSVMITVLSILICSAAGYAFIVYRSKATEIVFMILIASMMVPFAAKLIPLYRIFANLHLLNNYWAIILPAIGAPFLVFFFRQNSRIFRLRPFRQLGWMAAVRSAFFSESTCP